MGNFKIDVYDLCWKSGEADDPKDLCLHGHAVAYIGERRLEYDAAVSAAALYLLKSLTEEHIIDESIQMLPCCGHTILPNKALDGVDILGCPNGIDWSVKHIDNDVLLILEDGYETKVPKAEYKQEVFKFADKIEAFYNSCSPKQFCYGNKFSKDGYIAFWNEWHRRRQENK